MSIRRAFKQAVVEYLKEDAGLDPSSIAIVGNEGRPRPDCGELFLGVWGGSRTYGIKTAIDVSLSINLTLTKRFTGPIDRYDQALDAEADGMDDLLDGLVSLLTMHQNRIRARAEALMPPNTGGTSTAPRVLSDTSEPVPVGADWFEAGPGTGKGGALIYGLKSTLVYGGLGIIHPVPTAEV